MLVALAGGVGAARFLRGLVDVVPPSEVVAVVNTGDDFVVHGLHVSPDVDTVIYTLGGEVDPQRGWGLAGETWSVMEALGRYTAAAPVGSSGGITWFRLGDRDLATHLYRTQRLSEGAALSQVTAEVAAAWGVGVRVLPMSDGAVRTRLVVSDAGEVAFQDYFVRLRHQVAVSAVRFAGAQDARPAPGVIGAIRDAGTIVVCPSNPVVSIGPILSIPGIDEELGTRRDDVVAISPIIAGAALKGPADRLMRELGHEPSVVGVARLYAPVAATLVVDEADADLAPAVEAEGLRCVVAPTIMHGREHAAALARVVLKAVGAW